MNIIEIQSNQIQQLQSIQSQQYTPIGRVAQKENQISFDFSSSGIQFEILETTQLIIQTIGFIHLIISNESNEIEYTNIPSIPIDQIVKENAYQHVHYLKLSLPFSTEDINNKITIQKVTEARSSQVHILGLLEGKIQAIQKTETKPLIEFLGDSLTCGYGNMGHSHECETDSRKTWCHLLSQHFNCDYLLTSWSGIGLVRNNKCSTVDQLPVIRKRLVATDSSTTIDSFPWKCQYVFINIGTNDYSKESDKQLDIDFEKALDSLIKDCFNCYGSSLQIFLIEGPMIKNYGKEFIYQLFTQFDTKYENVHFIPCFIPNEYLSAIKAHPSAEGHEQMAQIIIDKVKQFF